MVEGEVFCHTIVEVPGLDGVLVLVKPVDSIPPGLSLIGRHDVVSLADLAGDVILSPGAGVASSVQTTLAGATGRVYAACQVQLNQLVLDLHASRLHDPHSHPELGRLTSHDVLNPLLQLRPGGARHKHDSIGWAIPGVLGHIFLLLPLSSLPLTGPVERDLATVGLLTLTLVTSEPVGDEVKSVGLAPPRQHELVRIF